MNETAKPGKFWFVQFVSLRKTVRFTQSFYQFSSDFDYKHMDERLAN